MVGPDRVRFQPVVVLGGVAIGGLGLAAASLALRPDPAGVLATAVVPPLVGVLMVGGALRWPRLLVPASGLLDLEAVLGGWLFVNGMALAILMPFVGLGLLGPVASRPIMRLGYVTAGGSALGGAVLAIAIGPTHGLPGIYPPPISLGLFAVLIVLALAFNWRTSGRLLEAVAETKRELATRERTEQELRETSDLLRAILDSSPITTMAFRLDQTVTVWNRAAERVFGWTAEVRVGHVLPVEMIPPEDRANSAGGIRRTLAGEVVEGDVARRLTKDGHDRWVEIYAAAIPGPDGAPVGIAAQFVDVTERIALDAELRQTKETFQALVAAAPLAIMLTDREGIIQVWNNAAERIYGPSAPEAVGQPITEITGMASAEFAALRRRLDAGDVIAGLPVSRQRRDGQPLELRLFLAPLHDGGGSVTGAVSVVEDVSDRRALEAQLRQAQKMETLGELAGSVAHDFNNLLTVIRGFGEMAEAALGPDHPVAADVAEIRRSADRAAELTTRLLTFSRQTPTASSVVELNAVIEGMSPMLHRLVGATIELRTALDPHAGHVRIDPGQLEQAILNLVVNARDAMPAGGVLALSTARSAIDQGVGATGPGRVVVTVRDTGTGMSRAVADRVFEPFFTTKGQGQGTGLGLSIVYGIVRNANGEVSVESTPGVGSAFRITLPMVASAETPIALAAAPPVGGQETILFVEDEEPIRRLGERVLGGAGYRVFVAAGAAEARELWSSHRSAIDLLLTDVTMPGGSGPALAAELLAERPEIRVLFVSGYVPGGRDGPLLPAGAKFMRKPFAIDDLLAAVRGAIDAAAPSVDNPVPRSRT